MKKIINEDYVSLEVAEMLQEKGFDIECFTAYYNGGLIDYTLFGFTDGVLLPAPTLQIVCKWLREIHNLHIMVNCVGRVNYDPIVQGFDGKDYEIEGVEVSTTKLINDKWMVVRRGFKTNELAVEAAIKYCLEKLIKNNV